MRAKSSHDSFPVPPCAATECRGPVTTRLSSRPVLTCSFAQLPAWDPSRSKPPPSQASSAADLRCPPRAHGSSVSPPPIARVWANQQRPPWEKCVLTPSRKGPVRRQRGSVPCGTPPPGCHDACSGYMSAQQGMAVGPGSALYGFMEPSVPPDLVCVHSSCSPHS
jgi:hypothetical protein